MSRGRKPEANQCVWLARSSDSITSHRQPGPVSSNERDVIRRPRITSSPLRGRRPFGGIATSVRRKWTSWASSNPRGSPPRTRRRWLIQAFSPTLLSCKLLKEKSRRISLGSLCSSFHYWHYGEPRLMKEKIGDERQQQPRSIMAPLAISSSKNDGTKIKITNARRWRNEYPRKITQTTALLECNEALHTPNTSNKLLLHTTSYYVARFLWRFLLHERSSLSLTLFPGRRPHGKTCRPQRRFDNWDTRTKHKLGAGWRTPLRYGEWVGTSCFFFVVVCC